MSDDLRVARTRTASNGTTARIYHFGAHNKLERRKEAGRDKAR